MISDDSLSTCPASTKAEAQQAVKYAADIKKIMNYLLSNQILSLKSISEQYGISEHTLYQFIRRSNEPNSASQTLIKLYRVVLTLSSQHFSGDEECRVLWGNVIDSADIIKAEGTQVYERFIAHMEPSSTQTRRAGQSLTGTYFVYRYSVIPGRMVRTKLDLFEDDAVVNLWRFNHFYKDQFGATRLTTGAMMVTMSTVYCFGKIGLGRGMEVIVFNQPVKTMPDVIIAMMLTTDTKDQPLMSRALLKRVELNDERDMGAFGSAEILSDLDGLAQFIDNTAIVDQPVRLKFT